MSENWKIQVSPKLPDGTLINLRAESGDEMTQELDWLIANAAKVQQAAQAAQAVGNVAAGFPGQGTQVVAQQTAPQPAAQPPYQNQQPQGPWSQQGSQQGPPPQWAGSPLPHPGQPQPQPQQAPQQAPQQQDGLLPQQFCSHGAMQLRHSKPGASRKWSAYMCPTPKDTPGQCKPVDAKTGKSWD